MSVLYIQNHHLYIQNHHLYIQNHHLYTHNHHLYTWRPIVLSQDMNDILKLHEARLND